MSRSFGLAGFVLLLGAGSLAFLTSDPSSNPTLDETLKGDVAINHYAHPELKEHRVLVRVDIRTPNRPLDGIPDRVYQLQTSEAPAMPPAVLHPDVVVHVSHGELRFMRRGGDQPFLSLAVEGYGSHERDLSVTGFGLSTACGQGFRTLALGDGILSEEEIALWEDSCPDTGAPGKCSAGGSGSTECSVAELLR